MPESEDPVIAALSAVDEGADHADPQPDAERDDLDDDGSRAHDQLGADLEGDDVDDPLAADLDEEESGFSVRSWAKRIPEGSHRDFDRTDWFDLEGGGENRIAYHLSDAVGDHGEGPYPNALGTVVGAFEAYLRLAKGKIDAPTIGSGDDEDDAEGGGLY